ncbi:MAG TPA: hypothetical protein PLR96_05740 [Flavobacteriales bacterium]|nr:hypothetical protein [Flavobacteriales bacterium]
MKQSSIIPTIALMAVLLSACKKEGPAGPAGPPGPSGNDNIETYHDETNGQTPFPITWSGGTGWSADQRLMSVTIPAGLDPGDIIITVAQFRASDVDLPQIPEPISIRATNFLSLSPDNVPGSGDGVDMSNSANAGSGWDPTATNAMYFSRSSTYTWDGPSVPSAEVALFVKPTSGNPDLLMDVNFGVGQLTVIVQRFEP